MNPRNLRNTTSPTFPFGGSHSVCEVACSSLLGFDSFFITQSNPSIVEHKQTISRLHKGVPATDFEHPISVFSSRMPSIFTSETARPLPVRSDGQTDGLRTAPSYYYVIGKTARTKEANEALMRVNEGASFGRTGTSGVSNRPEVL